MHFITINGLCQKISRLGLGTVKLGRDRGVKYPLPFTIPDDKQALHLLEHAALSGINVIDTAPAYGNSEQRLGKLLPVIKQDWVVITKVGEEWDCETSKYDFSEQHLRFSVERSLRRLGLDVLDIVLIHSNGDDKNIIERHQVFQTMNNLQTQGKIKLFGMSAKTLEGAMATIEHSNLLMYEVHHKLEDKDSIAKIMSYAQKKKKQVLIKKAFASGAMAQNTDRLQEIAQSFHYCLSFPATATIITGTINTQHLSENVQILDSLE